MATKLGHFLLSMTFTSFLFPALSTTHSGDTNWWCNKTPHPELCFHHLSQQAHTLAPMNKHEFQNMAAETAMNQALHALNQTKQFGPKCTNKKEKAAWKDCLKLYATTILQLNRTLDTTAEKRTNLDVQTWLSAAMTNLQTCRTGFLELGISDDIFPLLVVSNNVSDLISNALAINVESTEQVISEEEEFPRWVSERELRWVLELAETKPNVVVAKDGSGDFSTIKEALEGLGSRRERGRFVIHVKKGVYEEYVEVTDDMKDVVMVGDGINSTVITGNHSNRGGFTTFHSATFVATGRGFIARGITFRNTAGPESAQAVALISLSDLSVFYQCSFDGYQDTLYVHSNRQFYKECDIYGTVDFIFGNAAALLQNCSIFSRTRAPEKKNVVTAQGRTNPSQNTGISIHNSRVVTSQRTYLGRPWKDFSRTVYLQTFLDAMVEPAGWLEWKGNVETLFYGEYRNNGPGSSTSGRVKWGGYRVMKERAEAEKFTVGSFIGGQSWLPNTGVPFTPGL